MPKPLLTPSRWRGAAALEGILRRSGYTLPRRWAEVTAGDDAPPKAVDELVAFWCNRGDALLAAARAPTTEDANDAFAIAVDKHGRKRHPLEISRDNLSQERLAEFHRTGRRALYDAALSEAEARRISPLDLSTKASVRRMLMDEAADFGLRVLREGPDLQYPAVVLELMWGGGRILVTFDRGGRQDLTGFLGFSFFITYEDGKTVALGDGRYLLPGLEQYFLFVRSSMTAEGMLMIENSPLLATFGVRFAMDLPRMLAQAFQSDLSSLPD